MSSALSTVTAKPTSMEQVHHQWVVEEEEEEEELQDAALEGRESLQHRKERIIVTAAAPSFSSAPTENGVYSTSEEEEPLLQEEAPHAHKEEQKESPTQKEEQVEETSNVVENDKHFNDDSATLGLGIVAEFVGNAMDKESLKSATITVAASQNKNSVYFDKQQGMWKCHHCTWTKQYDSTWNVPLENLNGMNRHMWQFGIEMVVCGMLVGNNADGARFVLPKSFEEPEFDTRVENSDIQSNPCNVVNNQCVKAIDNKVHSPLHNSSEIQATKVENFGDVSSAKAYPNLTEEIDQQLKEFDVEAVLAKQETHDFPCIFTYLQCLCTNQLCVLKDLVTLAGNGIKLFPSFGGTHEPETSQNPLVTPASNMGSPSRVAASNANWFFSLFTSNKGKKTSGQGDASIENSTTGSTEQHHSSSFTDELTFPGIVNPESLLANAAISKDVKPKSDIKPGHGGVDSLIPSKVKSVKIESWIENGNRSSMVLQDQNDLSSTQSSESSSYVMNGLQKVGREQLLTENVRTDVGEKKHALVDMIKTGSPNGSMGFWDRAICLISSTILARPSAKLTNKLRVTDRYIVIDYKSSMNFSDDNVADIPKRESVPLATDPTTGINFNAGKPAKDDILKPCEGSPIFEESQQQPADKKPEIAPDSHPSLMEEARSPAQSFGSAVVADDGARDKQSSGVNATVPSDQEFKEVQKDIEEEINPYVSKEKKACVFMRNLTGSLSTPANFCVVVLPKLLPRVSWLLISIADIPKRESLPLATDATTEIDFNAAKPAKDAIPKPYEGPPISEKSQQHVDKEPKIAPDNYSSLMEEARSPAQSFGSAVAADDVVSDKQSPEVNAKIPLDQELKEVQKDIEEEINPSVTKEKKETVKSSTSQTADNVPVEGAIVTEAQTQIDIGEQPRAEIGENHDWQILKSIVYGGLIESITSLGIVSSAAAAGATPLNIIALGLANLIGGLFVIGHNLSELKNEQEDQYQELLGRKENFLLHAVVAVLSFLIFGSVPLVVYGLLISKQYYAEVKIAVVAVASIVCIILLAIGKVYTSRTSKSYIKTVLKYVTMALAASGLSYIAGNLFKELLDKFSRSESSYVLVMPLSSTRKMKPAWMSY
ncbi:hypothetical protein VNO77_09740 [Canavalia gladiata]|uniref:Membrane protein of ER body-like protein n=1 Tax=Canavalia gladiata TaxID=3824 RepID=A0AAN9MF19_CANGL